MKLEQDQPPFAGFLSHSFTNNSCRTFESAINESRKHGDGDVDTEHILLALVKDPTNIATQLIATKVDIGRIRTYAEFVIGNGEENLIDPVNTLTKGAKLVVELAIEEAEKDDSKIGTQHLLFGGIRQRMGLMAAALADFGITEKDLPELRERAKQLSEAKQNPQGQS